MSSYEKGMLVKVHHGNTLVGSFTATGDDKSDLAKCEEVLSKAGVKSEPIPLPVRTRQQAIAFANVALDLADKIMELLGNSRDYISPFLVNAAFAIELFLKALAQNHGLSPRGHSLLKLYDDLPDAAKLAIKHSRSGAPYELADFEGSEDLRKLFANLDDAFIAWRYAHEGNGNGRFYGAKMAILLLEVLDEATSDLN